MDGKEGGQVGRGGGARIPWQVAIDSEREGRWGRVSQPAVLRDGR